jgi:YVTN family beta-propeller protein
MRKKFSLAITAFAAASVVGVTPTLAQNAYVPSLSNTVSVIATATNTVTGSPIPVGVAPQGIAIKLDGSIVYVGNSTASG